MRTNVDVEPDLPAFRRMSAAYPLVPMWARIPTPSLTPLEAFSLLAGEGTGALLESGDRSDRSGRYSVAAGDPAAIVALDEGGVTVQAMTRPLPVEPPPGSLSPFGQLQAVATSLRAPRIPGLPPTVGGLVGFLSYEAAALLDGSPFPGPRPPGPTVVLQVVDRAVVFDHVERKLFLVAHVPAGGARLHRRGVEAVRSLAECVTAAAGRPEPSAARPTARPSSAAFDTAVDGDAAPDRERFLASVRRAKEEILAGEIFQAVLSRRRSVATARSAEEVYRRLGRTNPSPYMFLLRLAGIELAGSSPEPLVRVSGRRTMTRPIAGTRPRGREPHEDARLELELLADPKERAEHAMLVDLSRNDLGKVCEPGTVRPTELMAVERFSRVMHLVSTVEGVLRPGLGPLDALAATFPAGTVTGAPKRRAMEIIAEEEAVARGPYAGAVGYVTFAGDLDFCITIQTAVLQGGTAHVQAGAGIVADSDPGRELLETEAKAAAVLAAVDGTVR